MSKPSIAVTISGQRYRIRSDEAEDVLHRAASYVDAVMARIRDRTGTVDSHDVAVLTALNLSHELLLQRQQDPRFEADTARIDAIAALAEEALASLAGEGHRGEDASS
jgi:cell division protein ZapA